MRLRSELRSSWKSVVALTLIAGAFGGIVLGVAAGARRTATSVDRFTAYVGLPDGEIESEDPSLIERVEALPYIDIAQRAAFMLAGPVGDDGKRLVSTGSTFTIAISGRLRFRPLVVDGRIFDETRVDEVMIDEATADLLHARVGTEFSIAGISFEDVDAAFAGARVEPTVPAGSARVVGIVRFPDDLGARAGITDVVYMGSSAIFTTPAWFERYSEKVPGFAGLEVRFSHGNADVPTFERDLARLSNGKAAFHPGSDFANESQKAKRAANIQAFALSVFGVLAAIALIFVATQALSRQAIAASVEHQALRSIGASRSQLVGVAMLRTAIVGAGAGIIALFVAYAISAAMPTEGIARRAEISPGLSFDGLILGLGSIAVVMVVLLCGTVPAVRAARASAGSDRAGRRSRAAETFARAGFSPSAVSGVRLAFESGSGNRAVAVRSTLFGAATAVAALTAALVFSGSMKHLATDYRLQGWNWTFAVGNPHSPIDQESAEKALRADPSVLAFTAQASTVEATVDGKPMILTGQGQVQGTVEPPIVEGRLPRSGDEIAFGGKELRRLGKDIGDPVAVSGPGGSKEMRIVGRVILAPAVVNEQIELGGGAIVSLDTVRAINPEQAYVSQYLVRARPGDRSAMKKAFEATYLEPYRAGEVTDLSSVGGITVGLSGLLILLAVATLAHTLVSSVRRRARDLAILKTVGFVRRQVRAAVAWQASSTAIVAVLLGVPIGAVVGRWAWIAYAERLAIIPEPVVPIVLLVVGTLVGGLLMANAVAALPARAAARTQPALVLRAE